MNVVQELVAAAGIGAATGVSQGDSEGAVIAGVSAASVLLILRGIGELLKVIRNLRRKEKE